MLLHLDHELLWAGLFFSYVPIWEPSLLVFSYFLLHSICVRFHRIVYVSLCVFVRMCMY